MNIDAIIELHCAAFLASASRLALMLQDRTHLNELSREWNDEMKVIDHHYREAFKAKNVLATAERILKDQRKDGAA